MPTGVTNPLMECYMDSKIIHALSLYNLRLAAQQVASWLKEAEADYRPEDEFDPDLVGQSDIQWMEEEAVRLTCIGMSTIQKMEVDGTH